MIRKSCFLLILLIAIFPGTATCEEATAPKPSLSNLFNPADAERLLLVVFEDRTIQRATTTTSVATYRRRGHYHSSTWSQRLSNQIAEQYHLHKEAEWPMTEVGYHCVVYRVQAADSPIAVLRQLSEDNRIKIAQKMHLFNTQTNDHIDPYAALQSNLLSMQIDKAHVYATGRNVSIGMIDTGVDFEHPDLSGQIAQNTNFAEAVSPGFTDDKHGTAVAGIMVAKKDNGTGITGVAPNSKLVALKACWPEQQSSMSSVCNSFTLALAVNNAIKADVKVLNMSLTGPRDPLLELLLRKAIANGIVVVAADNGSTKDVDNFPATMPEVIAVQSHGAQTSDQQPVILAPGERILTTLPQGTYDFISGSSMAAAEVSGIVALMLELKPDLTLEEIKTLLHASCQQKKAGTIPTVNAFQTVTALCKTLPCNNEPLSYAWRSLHLR